MSNLANETWVESIRWALSAVSYQANVGKFRWLFRIAGTVTWALATFFGVIHL